MNLRSLRASRLSQTRWTAWNTVAWMAFALGACNSRKETPASESAARAPAAPRRLGTGVANSAAESAEASSGPADASDRLSPVVENSGCSAVPVQARTRFAVVGDYGKAGPAEARVAQLIKSLQVDFVLTTGDNNYPSGGADTIDANIGQFFREFICPYRGGYGAGSNVNRFFPTLGNHDWYSPTGSKPYRDYFTLPGNERYYDFVWGDVHVFAVDSDVNEPDGITSTSVQATWLKNALRRSKSKWNIVAMHHPPYSSGSHGSTPALQWPYKEWGANLVLAGHDHTYERIDVDGLPYVIVGLGGVSIYSFRAGLPGSAIRYNQNFGVGIIEVEATQLRFEFSNIDGGRIDEFSLASK